MNKFANGCEITRKYKNNSLTSFDCTKLAVIIQVLPKMAHIFQFCQKTQYFILAKYFENICRDFAPFNQNCIFSESPMQLLFSGTGWI